MRLALFPVVILACLASQGLAEKSYHKQAVWKGISDKQAHEDAAPGPISDHHVQKERLKKGPAKRNVVPPVALSQARTTNVTTPETLLSFPENVVDIGESFIRPTTINVSRSGIFLFHLNAGARVGKAVNMNVRGAGPNFDIYRGSTTHNGTDTTGRNLIAPVTAPAMVHFENEPHFELFSDEGRQTGFTTIDLKGYTDPYQQKIFSAARRTDLTANGPVLFSDVLVNEGGDLTGTTFVAKRTGPHFFTVSAGVMNGTVLRMSLMAKDLGELTEAWHSSSNTDGPDMVSKSLMVDLIAGDAVWVEKTAGTMYSDAERQASFGGFFYDPIDGNATAWSVYGVQSYTASGGLMDLPFHGQYTNTNGVYSFVDQKVTITQPGLYYIELNVQAQPFRRVNALVVLGSSKVEFSVDRASTSHMETGVLSNGLLLELFTGNTLKVVLGDDSSVYSDNHRLTLFTGFMVYPYPDV